MKLESSFAKTINTIQYLAGTLKAVDGVMLDIVDRETMYVCYNDGNKAFCQKEQIILEDGEEPRKIIMVLSKLYAITENLQCTNNNMFIEDITIKFDDKIATIEADKQIIVENAGERAIEYRQKINYFNVESKESVRLALLNRHDYEDMRKESDVEDEWEISEIKEVIAKMSGDSERNIYISADEGRVFSVSSNYTSVRNMSSDRSHNMIWGFNSYKAISSIINKLSNSGDDKVYIRADGDKTRFCYIRNDTWSLWFKMDNPRRADISSMKQYKAIEFDTLKTSFIRIVLADVLKSVINTDVTGNAEISFEYDEVDGNSMIINTTNALSSSDNSFRVMCQQLDGGDDTESVVKNIRLRVNIKNLMDVIDKLDSEYVTFDLKENDSAVNIRIGEIDFDLYDKDADRVSYLKSSSFTTYNI